MDEVARLSHIAAESALRKSGRNSLLTWFNFPAPIKTACQQYLVYFVQFLEDLGIKANSEIKEDAGRVLFNVTPEEGPEALEKIKEALEIYLNLPRNPEFKQATEASLDIAALQLSSQVQFLRSQLELAKAAIQAKDAAIQALDFTVFQQRQLLSSRFTKEESGVAPAERNEEPLLGDTVRVTTFEGRGFKVDLPGLLRRLKRRLGIGKSKAIDTPTPPHTKQLNQ